MKRRKRKKGRVKIFEIYIDNEEDISLAIRKINDVLKKINQNAERLILVLIDELKYSEIE